MLLHVTTNVTDTVFADTTIYGGTTYYYRIFVRDTVGVSVGSNIVTVTTPGGNFVTNGDFELDLSGWELYTPDPCVTIAYDLNIARRQQSVEGRNDCAGYGKYQLGGASDH